MAYNILQFVVIIIINVSKNKISKNFQNFKNEVDILGFLVGQSER